MIHRGPFQPLMFCDRDVPFLSCRYSWVKSCNSATSPYATGTLDSALELLAERWRAKFLQKLYYVTLIFKTNPRTPSQAKVKDQLFHWLELQHLPQLRHFSATASTKPTGWASFLFTAKYWPYPFALNIPEFCVKKKKGVFEPHLLAPFLPKQFFSHAANDLKMRWWKRISVVAVRDNLLAKVGTTQGPLSQCPSPPGR